MDSALPGAGPLTDIPPSALHCSEETMGALSSPTLPALGGTTDPVHFRGLQETGQE